MIADPNIKRGRIALSFDDDFVDRWFEAHNMLKQYNWRATFFVCKFRMLSGEEIEKLKILEAYGHEIASHTTKHLYAAEYVREHGMDAYLKYEIDESLDLMAKAGFSPTSFAYPYGSRSPGLTEELLKKFKVVRSTDNKHVEPALLKCVNNDSNHIFGMGIDNNYGASMEYIKSILDYARQEDKTAVLYAHKPVETIGVGGFIQTEYKRLIELCEYVNSINLEFATITECYINN